MPVLILVTSPACRDLPRVRFEMSGGQNGSMATPVTSASSPYFAILKAAVQQVGLRAWCRTAHSVAVRVCTRQRQDSFISTRVPPSTRFPGAATLCTAHCQSIVPSMQLPQPITRYAHMPIRMPTLAHPCTHPGVSAQGRQRLSGRGAHTHGGCVHACVRACVRACGRACRRAGGRAGGRAGVHACGRAGVRACMRACVQACGRAGVRAGVRGMP